MRSFLSGRVVVPGLLASLGLLAFLPRLLHSAEPATPSPATKDTSHRVQLASLQTDALGDKALSREQYLALITARNPPAATPAPKAKVAKAPPHEPQMVATLQNTPGGTPTPAFKNAKPITREAPQAAASPRHAAATPAIVSHTGKASSRESQMALAALVAGVAQSPLQAVGPTLAQADLARSRQAALAAAAAAAAKVAPTAAPALVSHGVPVDVLMIGDSLSVGGFGDEVQQYLFKRYTSNRVAFYASCGSSPEHWLKTGPDFVTRCGFKVQTPQKKYYTDFDGKRPPTPTLTPKLEDLLAYHQPSVVIVQLGTNWMDAMEGKDFASQKAHFVAILDRFAAAIHAARCVQQVVWITPPDSSKYAPAIERNVDWLLRDTANQNSYALVDSSYPMTHYVMGKSGGDGVHYGKREAYAWAESVEKELVGKLR